jgi:tetratricopeptide (TPR) repeat protein
MPLARRLGDRSRLAQVLIAVGSPSHELGDHEAADRCWDEVLELAQGEAMAWLRFAALNNRGLGALSRADYETAGRAFEEAARLEPDDPIPLHNLGLVALGRERDDDALRYFARSLRATRAWVGATRMPTLAVEGIAAATAAGDGRTAARLLGAAEHELARLGTSRGRLEQRVHERTEAALCSGLGEAAFRAARAEGSSLPFEQAVELGLALAAEHEPSA